jgi:predicted nuclease with TOPRIM domain
MSDFITNAELRIEAERLCDENEQLRSEKAALERRIDELCAEVERLRKAKDTMRGDAFEIGAMLVKARDENAKLRRLTQQIYPYAKAHLQLGVALGCNDTLSYDWALQMVELGIEVPE